MYQLQELYHASEILLIPSLHEALQKKNNNKVSGNFIPISQIQMQYKRKKFGSDDQTE